MISRPYVQGGKGKEQRDLRRKLVFRKSDIHRSPLACIWKLLVIYTLATDELNRHKPGAW